MYNPEMIAAFGLALVRDCAVNDFPAPGALPVIEAMSSLNPKVRLLGLKLSYKMPLCAADS